MYRYSMNNQNFISEVQKQIEIFNEVSKVMMERLSDDDDKKMLKILLLQNVDELGRKIENL